MKEEFEDRRESTEHMLKHLTKLIKDNFMTIMDELKAIEAKQAQPVTATLDSTVLAQLAGMAAGISAIQAVLPAPSGAVPPVPSTTTAKILTLNLADAAVSATGAGLFTPGTFTINGVTVTVAANDSLATIATNIQAALQAAGHTNASAAASDSPGNFTLTVIDPHTGSGLGFQGAAVAGLNIPAPTFS